MSGLSRYMSVLRLFDAAKPDWTVAEIGDRLGRPHSTVYRTIRDLAADGFIEASTEAHYRLGAAFVEFDRIIRVTDPLVQSGAPILRDLVREARLPAVATLARLYGDRVICAADEKTEGAAIETSYERGRPMPLTRGATSRAILAYLPRQRLRKLVQTPESGVTEVTLPDLLQNLASVRSGGFSVTRGEVDMGLVGVAVPIRNEGLAIAASLSLILRAESLTPKIEQRLVLLLVSCGNLISERIRETGSARV